MLVSNVVLSLWLQNIFTDNITLIPPPLLGPSWSPKQRREELAWYRVLKVLSIYTDIWPNANIGLKKGGGGIKVMSLIFQKKYAGWKIRIFESKTGESLLCPPPSPPMSLDVTFCFPPPPKPVTSLVNSLKGIAGLLILLLDVNKICWSPWVKLWSTCSDNVAGIGWE